MVSGGDDRSVWGPPEPAQSGFPASPPAPWPPPAAPPLSSAPLQPGGLPQQAVPPPDPAVPPRRGRRGLLVVVASVAVVALLACGGVGVAMLVTSGDPRPHETTAPSQAPVTPSGGLPGTPSPSPSPTASAGTFTDISSRATDPRPLTVKDVFPTPKVSINNAVYSVLGTQVVSNCRLAASGKIATAAAAAGCTQVVRATVSDPTSQYLVTVGIANLPTAAAADQLYRLLDDPVKNGYFTRLNGTGPAQGFADARATIVGSLTRGHYVIYAVGGRPGRTSASLADERLKTTLKDMRLYANDAITKRTFGS